eukprot:2959145-Pyramimonas_sp.AAC.1
MFITDMPRAAFTASGVGLGTVYRALGGAMDLRDYLSSRPFPAGMPLLCMALARYALEFALGEDRAEALIEHFREGGRFHFPGADAVERFFVMRMPC